MIYSRPPATHPTTPVKIALLTGLSNPANCALSDVQRAFMVSLPFPEAWKVYCNFPWTGEDGEWSATPLWQACLHNGWQFLAASTPFFRRAARTHWEAMLASTDRLLIMAGSCGLQMINCLLAGPSRSTTRVAVLGFGPVAWRRPPVACQLVRNRRDPVSFAFFPKTDALLAGRGHMQYLEEPQLIEIVEQWISNSVSE